MRLPLRLAGLICALVGLVALARADNAAAGARPRVGMLTDNYPFSFAQPDGKLTGFSTELTAEIESVMALRLERATGTTRDVHQRFETGEIELLQAYARFPERERRVDFSVPYLRMTGALFVRGRRAAVETLDDCRGRKVAVHRGSLGEAILRRANLEASIYIVDSVEDGLKAVARGEADATLVGRLSGAALAYHLGLTDVHAVDNDVSGYEVEYCYAVQKGDARLLAQVNEGLAILVRTGRFDRLYRKWFGHIEPAHYSAQDVTMFVAIGLTVALALALWTVWHLRRLQARLARQAEEFRAVFDGAHSGLLVLEPDAEQQLRIRQINPAARTLLVPDGSQAEGMRFGVLLGAEAALEREVRRASPPAEVRRFHYEKSQGSGWWHVSVGPLGRSLLVSVQDVTEQVRAREQLAQQEKRLLETQKLEAIGRLAGGIAHDFNNVLTAVLGHAELSLMSLPAGRPEIESMRQIIHGGRRARQLVQQILAFSRRSGATRQPVPVLPLVAETIDFLRVLGRGGIELEHNVAAQLPAILADPTQAHQVLMNIGTNAVQAMQGVGGRVTFTAEIVEIADAARSRVDSLAPGRYVRIGIQDDGPGMTPEIVSRVFEPFFSTKAPGHGTGLGLAVVHGIMQQHGGAVTVFSQPGRGTLFNVFFPVAPADAEAAARPPAEIPRGKGEQILLVDDDVAVVGTVRQILVQLGYRVTAFERPVAALAEFEARPADFALVLTDLTMPGMSGLQLIARIRAWKPTQPVLIASGFFTSAEELEAGKLRVTRLLHKPLAFAQLGEAIAAALASGKS
ncbi:MAG: transporter substrate-binding domain-containing protein [Candidatus Didemnitutus sp.]|nr:transporter substrate-binding domain-containing protein [Candidatus Didemnitutus sp.]